MIRRLVNRYGYPVSVVMLTAAILVVGGFLLFVAVPDLNGTVAMRATPAPTAEPSPLSPMGLSAIGIEMAPDSDCSACHVTDSGVVGTLDIPRMGHPLWGWRDCTACHATGSLVDTAPGHSGLHKQDCLVCHKEPDQETSGPAKPRPEHMGGDQPCTACHGVDDHAPLPDAMAGRENCWVCHNGPEFTYLFEESASPEAPPPAG